MIIGLATSAPKCMAGRLHTAEHRGEGRVLTMDNVCPHVTIMGRQCGFLLRNLTGKSPPAGGSKICPKKINFWQWQKLSQKKAKLTTFKMDKLKNVKKSPSLVAFSQFKGGGGIFLYFPKIPTGSYFWRGFWTFAENRQGSYWGGVMESNCMTGWGSWSVPLVGTWHPGFSACRIRGNGVVHKKRDRMG